MNVLELPKPHAFSLAAARQFYAGFTPGAGMAAAAVDQLTLAFNLDRTFTPVVASLREDARSLLVEYVGSDDARAVQRQIGRMLGLEGNASDWVELGRRVPLVGRLQAEFPGFFTAAKASPYDAAIWSVISPRMHPTQAARIRMALARDHGTALSLHGRLHHVAPAPARLLDVTYVEGLSTEKLARLRGVARAALLGLLDADALRGMGEADALASLQTIRGIGPWSASHIYFRGAAPLDGLPTAEPRVLHGLAEASGSLVPSAAAFERVAEAWRPFRMWVCVLLSRHLAGAGAWHAPSLPRERATLSRALAKKTRQRALPFSG